MSPQLILGYWDTRGKAEPIRLLLKYAGVEFQDLRYGPRDDKTWYNLKFSLGFDFPNLPYLIDGDVKLTQSLVISRYLGRKYKLDGVTEIEKNRIAILEQQVIDLSTAYGQFRRRNPTVEDKAEFRKNLEIQFELLKKFLSVGKYVAGDIVSYADFILYEYLRAAKGIEIADGLLTKNESIRKFIQQIETLTQLADYLTQFNAKKN